MGNEINLTPGPFPKGKGSLAELKAQALEDALDKLKAAVEEKLNPSPLPPGPTTLAQASPAVAGEGALRYWVFRTYPDFVVARRGDEFFKVEYSLDGAGELTIEKPVAVERVESWIPAEMKALKEYPSPPSPLPSLRDGRGEEDDMLVFFGGEAKALADGKVGGYLVRFSTAKDPDISEERDFFTPETNFGDHKATDVFYHHGLDRKIGKKSIGRGELRVDDVGVWIEAQLKMRDAYEKAIYKLAKAGKLGWSSATVPSLVTRVNEGKAHRITQWLLGIDASLLTIPAEPRNAAVAMKSLAFAEDELEALEEGQETLDGAAAKASPHPNPLPPFGRAREQNQGVKEMEPKDIEKMIADGIAASRKADEEAAAAKAAQQAEIDAAVKAAKDEMKAEWAKGNRLPMGAPAVTHLAEWGKFDNLTPQDMAVMVGIMSAAKGQKFHDVECEGPSGLALKCLAMKLEGDKSEFGEIGRMAMKSAGIEAKANELDYSTYSNYGSDWVGTAYSQAIWDAIRAGTFVVQKLMPFAMEIPQGYSSNTIPLEGADPTWYKVAETTDDDDTTLSPATSVTSSKLGTANKNITIAKMGARVMFSGEMTEDSLVMFAAQLRRQLEASGAEMLEHVIVDGDSTTTGSTNINDIGNGSTQTATNLHLMFNGFRKSCLVTTTANSRSASGTLSVDDYLATVKLMGTAGINALDITKVGYVIDPNTYWATMALPEVKTRDVSAAPTIEGGKLTGLWGYPLTVSAFMHYKSATRKANTAGKVDQTTTTNNTTGAILAVRWDQWRLAWKRRMTMEVTRIPRADASEIVALMRVGLGQRDTEASAITYNVGV